MSDFVTPWTVVSQVLLSMRSCRQDYWTGLLGLLPGDFLDPGIQPASLSSPALTGGFLTAGATWEARMFISLLFSVSVPLY